MTIDTTHTHTHMPHQLTQFSIAVQSDGWKPTTTTGKHYLGATGGPLYTPVGEVDERGAQIHSLNSGE